MEIWNARRPILSHWDKHCLLACFKAPLFSMRGFLFFGRPHCSCSSTPQLTGGAIEDASTRLIRTARLEPPAERAKNAVPH